MMRAFSNTHIHVYGWAVMLVLALFFIAASAEAATIGRPMNNGGLVGYWSFDYATDGMTVYDRSGNGNNGSLTNATGSANWVNGRVGSAMDFDGDNDSINLGSITAGNPLMLNGDAVTISAWVYWRGFGDTYQRILSKSDGIVDANGYGVWIGGTDGTIANVGLGINGASWGGASTLINTGEWTHLVWTVTAAGVVEGYVNLVDAGVFLWSGSTTTIPNATTNMRLGTWNHAADREFNGIMDEIRIYNRALSAGEIERLYNFSAPKIAKTPTVVENGLISHWTFDGGDTNVGSTTLDVLDRAGSNDGNFIGADTFPETLAPTITSSGPISATSLPVNLPSIVNPGDLLLVFMESDFTPTEGTITTPSGWTELWASSTIALRTGHGTGFAKIADGSEGGTTLTFTASQTVVANVAHAYRVTNWYGSLSGVAVGTPVVETGITNPNPPSLTASWGGLNNLWFAVAGYVDDDDIMTAFPGSYGNGASTTSGGGTDAGAGIGTARRELANATENPGTFTLSGAEAAVSNTLVVRPRNALPMVPGQIGQALDFDGTDDHVLIPNDSSFQNLTNHSLSAWIYPRDLSATTQVIVEKFDGTEPVEYNMYLFDGNLRSWKVSGCDSAVELTTDWHHVAMSYDGTNTTVYVDGIARNTCAQAYTSANGNLAIGSRPSGGLPFDGKIDDVRVYDRTLSADEVARIYTATRPSEVAKPVLSEGLVGYWSMENVSDHVIVHDRSGNGLNGTLENAAGAASWVNGKIGGGIDFDGDNNQVNMGDPTTLQLTGSMSISAWVNSNDFSGQGAECCTVIANKLGFSPNRGYSLQTSPSDGNFRFYIASNGTTLASIFSATVASTGFWYHLVGVYNAASQTMDIYVNGTLDNGTLTGTVPASQHSNNGQDFMIGGREDHADMHFDGTIDEVRIYDRALSSEEVRRLYNLGL